MKQEALKLADELQDYMTSLGWETHQAPEMIRRLVEELDKQEHCCPDCGCHFVGEYPFNNAPQTKPLTNEEIAEIYKDFTMFNTPYWFARAIEERHGIK